MERHQGNPWTFKQVLNQRLTGWCADLAHSVRLGIALRYDLHERIDSTLSLCEPAIREAYRGQVHEILHHEFLKAVAANGGPPLRLVWAYRPKDDRPEDIRPAQKALAQLEQAADSFRTIVHPNLLEQLKRVYAKGVDAKTILATKVDSDVC